MPKVETIWPESKVESSRPRPKSSQVILGQSWAESSLAEIDSSWPEPISSEVGPSRSWA